MKIEGDAQLLRIFVSEDDKCGHRPLYKCIVEKAREEGLAGATVLRGIMGFGAHSRMHTGGILRISEDLPVVIEIVDREDRIQAFIPGLQDMIHEGLITLEKAHVIAYKYSGKDKSSDTTPDDTPR